MVVTAVLSFVVLDYVFVLVSGDIHNWYLLLLTATLAFCAGVWAAAFTQTKFRSIARKR